jgi:hypothetical protein
MPFFIALIAILILIGLVNLFGFGIGFANMLILGRFRPAL